MAASLISETTEGRVMRVVHFCSKVEGEQRLRMIGPVSRIREWISVGFEASGGLNVD